MLPLPNLDDRTFEDIMAEARRRIPVLFPEWTDENAHDPGITMLELFAWLTEMQQYYLNRVTEQQKRKFLKLVGMKPKEAERAAMHIHIQSLREPVTLPRGTPVTTHGQTFETDRSLLLIPGGIDRVIVHTGQDLTDRSTANSGLDVSFYAFGPKALAGSRLYLGLDHQLPEGRLLHLTAMMRMPGESESSQLQEDIHAYLKPSARLKWSYYAAAGSGLHGDGAGDEEEHWRTLPVETDTTVGFSHSGRVAFRLDAPMSKLMLYPASDRPRYWLCVTVAEGSYEKVPQISHLHLNAAQVIHGQTLMDVQTFDGSGESGFSIHSDHYLSYYGEVQVQVREPDGGWRYWSDRQANSVPDDVTGMYYSIYRDPETKHTFISFGGRINDVSVPRGFKNVRVISSLLPPGRTNRFGTSSGLPNQALPIGIGGILPPAFRLQVAERRETDGSLIWYDWTRADDFDRSGPADRHYALDEDADTVRFGNHDHGVIPPKPDDGEPHIAFIGCVIGGGAQGNVRGDLGLTMAVLSDEQPQALALNLFPASGGADKESVADAESRLRSELFEDRAAVTAGDYERQAMQVPGLQMARVKALALYKPGMTDYPKRTADAQMTVVVMPVSDRPAPAPSAGFLASVRRHLLPYRMIATELHVIAPAYIEVTVQATVVCEAEAGDVEARVVAELERFLTPYRSEAGRQTGWTFGHPVQKGELYGLINGVPGVVYVEALSLHSRGEGAKRTREGDIAIPPHGLVFSGGHAIAGVKSTQR